jgi:hypothetical protein
MCIFKKKHSTYTIILENRDLIGNPWSIYIHEFLKVNITKHIEVSYIKVEMSKNEDMWSPDSVCRDEGQKTLQAQS